MITTPEIYAQLEARRAELGLSQADVGRRAFGKADGSALQNMKRGSSPSVETLSALCDALGIELYFGRPRVVSDGFADPADPSELGKIEAIRSGYIPIPWHDQARRPASCPVAFDRLWLEDHALLADNLRAVLPDVSHVSGLPAALTVVVVDTAPHRHQGGGLMAFKRSGHAHVGYLSFVRDLTLIAAPDPTEGATVIFPDDDPPIRILGPVVWSGQLWR